MPPSTPRQIMLKKAGEAMSPDKSVDRLNALAQLLLANITLVGTVLTILGAFTDIGDAFSDTPWLVVPPFVLVTATVGAALFALAPQPKHFNPAILTEISHIYAVTIRRKQLAVLIGFATLILAIIAAGLPALLTALDDDEITAQMSLGFNTVAGTSGATKVAQATVELEHVPKGAVVQVKVTEGPAETGEVLASRQVVIGSSGEVDLTFDSITGKDIRSATLSAVVTEDGREIFSRQIPSE